MSGMFRYQDISFLKRKEKNNIGSNYWQCFLRNSQHQDSWLQQRCLMQLQVHSCWPYCGRSLVIAFFFLRKMASISLILLLIWHLPAISLVLLLYLGLMGGHTKRECAVFSFYLLSVQNWSFYYNDYNAWSCDVKTPFKISKSPNSNKMKQSKFEPAHLRVCNMKLSNHKVVCLETEEEAGWDTNQNRLATKSRQSAPNTTSIIPFAPHGIII